MAVADSPVAAPVNDTIQFGFESRQLTNPVLDPGSMSTRDLIHSLARTIRVGGELEQLPNG